MAESAKFPKAEKLCGKHDIAALMAHGRRGACDCIRYCCLVSPQEAPSDGEAAPLDSARVMVSVPKKHFKRAVRRNLLKRRIREAYRLQKALLLGSGSALSVMAGPDRPSRRYDILFTYVGSDIASYDDIASAVASILKEIRRWER